MLRDQITVGLWSAANIGLALDQSWQYKKNYCKKVFVHKCKAGTIVRLPTAQKPTNSFAYISFIFVILLDTIEKGYGPSVFLSKNRILHFGGFF